VPAPASDRTLQLWIIPTQGNPIDAGIFRPDANGRALYIASPGVSISQAAALAITDEPAGGQPQPTTTPIWVGQIG
jgi:anti-sigma-K factor RskA